MKTTRLWLSAVAVCLVWSFTAGAAWTPVVPGIDYQEYAVTMSDGQPNKIFVARMDRSNQSCIIDSTLAMGRLSTTRETVPSMATRYDDTINYWGESWGQRSDVVVAINGDGWTSAPGPTNGQVISGWQAKRWPEYSGYSGFYFTLDRECFIGGNVRNGNTAGMQYQFIFFANGGNAVPTNVNVARTGGSELIVFTPQFADNTGTDSSGTEVLVEMTRPLVSLPVAGPEYVYGTIRQKRPNAGSTPIPFDHVVLSGTGPYATLLNNNCVVGDQIRFQFEIHDYGLNRQVPMPPRDWTKAYASVGVFAYVVMDGIVPENDWVNNSSAWVRNPRTAVAFNDNYVYFFVCDGRWPGVSVGMTYPEMGNWLINNLGAQWATNQDGGGSSTIWVNGQVKNCPSDGGAGWCQSPRPVANGLVMAVVQPKVQSTNLATAQLVTTNTSANVRLGPGTNYGILTTVAGGAQGQVVSQSLNGVLAKGYNWWYVNFGGTVGWVAESLLIPGGIAPTITSHPVPVTLAVGGTAVFTVTASGDAPLAYQWQKNGANLANGGHYSGATTATLTVSNADINDVASYRCVVSNTYGTATSNAAALTLSGQPTITQHPTPQNACTGGTAVFTVVASGPGTLTYRWQKNSVNLSDGGHYSGATTPALTISNADGSDAGSYRCVVTNAAGNTNSNQAPLSIDAVHAIVGMGGTNSTITGVSTDGAVVAGNNSAGGFIWSTANGVVGLGAGTSTAGAATKNAAVVVGGLNGGSASRWDGNTAGVGSWTTLPLADGTLTWTPLCTSAQDGSPGNAWVGGSSVSVPDQGRKAVRYKESAASTSSLALPPNGNTDAYIYGISDVGSYAGRYQYGNISPSGSRQAMGGSTLVALSPLIGAPSTKNEGVANAISRNGAKAGGWSESPTSGRQGTIWTIANPTVPFGVPFIGTDDYGEVQALNADGSVVAGYARTLAVSGSQHAIIWDATNGTRDLKTWLITQYGLDLTGWTLTDVRGMSGDGKVIAGNGTYNSVSQAWVVLLGVPGQPPSITQHPAGQTICTGASAAFTVAANGLGMLSYRWQKNGTDLTDGGHYSGATTATLSIANADSGDAADYRCVVSAGCDSAPSNAAALTVKPATAITQQPTAQSTCLGLTVQFTIAATGDGAISYRWQKGGVDLSDGGHYAGTGTPTLVVSNADLGDAAGYRCVVTAGCGAATSDEVAVTLVPTVSSDLDQDCDVDVDDFDLFAACASGAGVDHDGSPICAAADLDDDTDVDQADFAAFQRCLSGSGIPADPNCGN